MARKTKRAAAAKGQRPARKATKGSRTSRKRRPGPSAAPSDAAARLATDPRHLAEVARSGAVELVGEPGAFYRVEKVESTGWVTYRALDAAGLPVGPAHTVTADRVAARELVGPTSPPGAAVEVRGGRKGRAWTGQLLADGRLVVEGMTHRSPSAAATALCGGVAVNGWRFWRLSDGRTIDVLRDANGRRRSAQAVDVAALQARRARIVNRIAALAARLVAVDAKIGAAAG